MKNLFPIAALILSIILLAGCASPVAGPDGPEWIRKAGGVYKAEDGQSAMFAVGSYKVGPNFDFTMKTARASGRDEMARQISVHVQNMYTSFEREAMDFYDEATASSIVNKEDVSRQIAQATLTGSRQIDAWEDKDKGRYFVLMRMDLDKSFYEEVKKKGNAAYREGFAKYSGELKEGALDKMDANIDKQIDKSSQGYTTFKVK